MVLYDGIPYYSEKINIDEIKVSEDFKEHKPSRDKIDDAIAYYKAYGFLDKIPVLSRKFYIIDNYSRYLAAKLLGIREIDVFVEYKMPTCYVYGIHPDDKLHKERVWRVPKNKEFTGWSASVLPGDTVFVKTCRGNAPIIVTKIEWSDERPRKERIRSVCLRKD